jgi:hypothetical protein
MRALLKLALPAGLSVLFAGCAGLSSGSLSTESLGQLQTTQAGMPDVPRGAHAMAVVRPGASGAFKKVKGLLVYGGGAVQRTPTIYVLYWGFKGKGDPGKAEQNILNPFLQGVGGSAWLNTVTQYYDTQGLITNPTGQYTNKLNVGYILDNSKVPASPQDPQIQVEAQKLVAKFGANADAAYLVATPHDHNSPGFGTEFCAYHSTFMSGSVRISYIDFPYQSDAQKGSCGSGMVNDPGTYDGVTITSGHEVAETQTDPGADNSGWGGSFGEIADICAGDATTSNQPFSTGSFPVQPLYSDEAKACVLSGP